MEAESWLVMGMAVMDLHKEGLWKDTHKTWALFVQEELNRTTRWSHLKIQNTEEAMRLSGVVPDVIDVIVSEQNVAAFKDVPDNKIQAVVDSAKRIAAENSTNRVYNKHITQAIANQNKEEVTTKLVPITTNHRAAHQAVENGKLLKSIAGELAMVLKNMAGVPNVPGMEEYMSRKQGIMMQAKSVLDAVMATKPHAVCPRCNGAGCVQCGNMGWINNVLAKQYKQDSVDY